MINFQRIYRCYGEKGEGFYIGHTGRVIIHPEAEFGKNINVGIGATIGYEECGTTIGSKCVFCLVYLSKYSRGACFFVRKKTEYEPKRGKVC